MTRPPPTTRAAVAAFLAGVFTFRPGLLATVLSLQIVQGLAEAATFTLLSPWLASVGVVDLSGPGGWLVGMLTPLGTFAGPAWTLEITLGMFLCVMLARAALAYASTALSCRYVTSYAEHARTSLYRALSRARPPRSATAGGGLGVRGNRMIRRIHMHVHARTHAHVCMIPCPGSHDRTHPCTIVQGT